MHWHGPPLMAGLEYEAIERGPGATLGCVRAAVALTTLAEVPVAAMVFIAEPHHQPTLRLEIVAATTEAADAFLARIRELMEIHNVMRGQVLSFVFGRHGDYQPTFSAVSNVEREQLVLPPGCFEAIESHAIGISEARDDLRAAGYHIKRGLLLYGPPGTGKTHTIGHLLTRQRGRTTVVLSGTALGAIGQAGTIARSLQPATIVIEDVDLIAFDRDMPGEHSLLFQLLNEMDGLHDDADVLFILTTNRVDVLEPALAQRPGRIDQAVEIPLPDADGRRALFGLYLRGDLDPDVLATAIGQTEGVAAAFVKELGRRVTLRARQQGTTSSAVLLVSLDDMMQSAPAVLRSSLAAKPVD